MPGPSLNLDGPWPPATDFRCTDCGVTFGAHGMADHDYRPGLAELTAREKVTADRDPRTRADSRAVKDTQVGGAHYLRAIQIWDIVEVWELDFFRGSALKYLLRAGNKGSKVEDLKKARHVLDKAIEIAEKEEG